MKIDRLNIRGFRSLKNVSWTPDHLNIVIGPNGTGRSNLLRMLELISASARGRLGRYVQHAGGMEPLVWDGAAESIDFDIKVSPTDETRDTVQKAMIAMIYQAEMKRLGKSSMFRIGHELLSERNRPVSLLKREGLKASVFVEQGTTEDFLPEESVSEDETLLSMTAGPFTANPHIPPFRAQLAGWCVYHDFHVHPDAVVRQPVVARVEKRVDADGQNLIPVLHTLYTGDREFRKDTDLAMRAAFGDDYDELVFPPAADQRIQLLVRWKTLRREQSAADLSDGTLRFLFLLTVLASPSPPPLIAIDEPETGLHPSMLPIVAEYAVDAAERTQLILTTHSPQFLDAFEEILPATTVTKWVGGEMVLRMPDKENLRYWLNEYSLGSLFKSGELEDMI